MNIKNKMTKLTASFLSVFIIITAMMPNNSFAYSTGVDVAFSALAVCADNGADNSADEILIVFEQATDGTVTGDDMMSLLLLDEANDFGTSTGSWDSTNTIFKIILSDEATITIGATINFINDGTKKVKTEIGEEIINDSSAIISKNFDGPSAPKVIGAFISDQDGTSNTKDDIIYVIFDKPTNNTANTKETFLEDNCLKNASGNWIDSKTLAITLAETPIEMSDKIDLTSLKIKDITSSIDAINVDAIALSGSFELSTKSSIVSVVATDEDGTAKTVGDKIIISFDRATNKIAGETVNFVDENNLKGASGEWKSSQTLEIILGNAKISTTETLDISSLNIKDVSGIIDVENTENVAFTGGSFGNAIKPSVVKAVAVSKTGNSSASEGDQIVIMFNTVVTHNTIIVGCDRGSLGTDFNNEDKDENGNNEFIKWKDDGVTTLTLTLGANPLVEINRAEIKLIGEIKDAYSQTLLCENAGTILIADGSFGIKIIPELVSATIVKVSDRPTASIGDKIVLVFSAPTNKANIAGYFGGAFGNGAEGEWNENGTVYTVELKNDVSSLNDNATVTLQASSGLKDQYGIGDVPSASQLLKGSFGVANKPEFLSATVVKKTTKAKAQKDDEIVLVFSTMTNKDGNMENKILSNGTNAFGTNAVYSWDSATGTVLTIILGADPTVADSAIIKLDNASGLLKDNHNVIAVDTKEVELKGTFGETFPEFPQIVSALGYSSGNSDYIKVTFNMETNLMDLNIDDNFKNTLKTKNINLGDITEVTKTDTTLVIKLPSNATIKCGDTLELSSLGIKSKSTGTDLAETLISCEGYLVPLVLDVAAETGVILIKFTTQTNAAAIDLSELTLLYGENATASWNDSKTLKITLGKNYGINERGYITLDNLGIKDGYAGSYIVSGQYQIQSGSFTSDELTVRNAIATSETTEIVSASKGDEITITFSHSTNTLELLDTIVDRVETVDARSVENAFGTGAQAKWRNNKTLVITLGDEPTIKRDDVIFFKTSNITKLSGTILKTESVKVKGSFDGRDFYVIGDYSKTSGANGDHQFKVTIEDTSKTIAPKPTIVCVAYNGSSPVSISRVSTGVTESADVLFTFSGAYTINSAKIYVFNGLFDEITSSPEVIAEMKTIEVK